MSCEIDGWVQGGMQFGVLVYVLCLVLFELLVLVRAHCIWIDGRVLGHAVWVLVQGALLFGVFVEVLATVRAHFCEIDCRVLGRGKQVTALAQFCKRVLGHAVRNS